MSAACRSPIGARAPFPLLPCLHAAPLSQTPPPQRLSPPHSLKKGLGARHRPPFLLTPFLPRLDRARSPHSSPPPLVHIGAEVRRRRRRSQSHHPLPPVPSVSSTMPSLPFSFGPHLTPRCSRTSPSPLLPTEEPSPARTPPPPSRPATLTPSCHLGEPCSAPLCQERSPSSCGAHAATTTARRQPASPIDSRHRSGPTRGYHVGHAPCACPAGMARPFWPMGWARRPKS
jgi:hypothetical protein